MWWNSGELFVINLQGALTFSERSHKATLEGFGKFTCTEICHVGQILLDIKYALFLILTNTSRACSVHIVLDWKTEPHRSARPLHLAGVAVRDVLYFYSQVNNTFPQCRDLYFNLLPVNSSINKWCSCWPASTCTLMAVYIHDSHDIAYRRFTQHTR